MRASSPCLRLRFEHGSRALDLPHDLLAPALGLGQPDAATSSRTSFASSSRRASPISAAASIASSSTAPASANSPRSISASPRSGSSSSRSGDSSGTQHGRATEEACGGRHVAAAERPACRRAQALRSPAHRARCRARRAGRARRGSGRPARGGSRESPRTRRRGRSRPGPPTRRTARAASRGALEQAAVGRVADHDVPEAVALALVGGRIDLDEPLARERVEVDPSCSRSASGTSSSSAVHREHLADHGRSLDDGPLLVGEPVEPGGHQRLDRRRRRQVVEMSEVGTPDAVLEAQEPVVDHHREQLLDEERVAVGCLDDPAARLLVDPGLRRGWRR